MRTKTKTICENCFLLRWVRNNSAFPARDGVGSAATLGNFVHQDWVASCTVRSLQRRECPGHCERHQVQTKPKPVRLGHLRGDAYVKAWELQSS